MTKINQCRNHLFKIGNISSWEAIEHFRATRLSAYIHIFIHRDGSFIIPVSEKNRVTEANYTRYFYPEGCTQMEREELYEKVCKAEKEYPEGVEREKIRVQKSELERRYPVLTRGKNEN